MAKKPAKITAKPGHKFYLAMARDPNDPVACPGKSKGMLLRECDPNKEHRNAGILDGTFCIVELPAGQVRKAELAKRLAHVDLGTKKRTEPPAAALGNQIRRAEWKKEQAAEGARRLVELDNGPAQ